MASTFVLPMAIRLATYSLPGPGSRSWVIAIRWRAALSWRLPPRLSRWRTELPDHTGIGADPLWFAKAAREWKRPTPAVSPTILAAVSGPHPGSANNEGASSCVRSRIARPSASIARVSSPNPNDQIAPDLDLCIDVVHGRPGNLAELLVHLDENSRLRKRSGSWLLNAEPDQEPAQARLVSRALCDQILAMVHEEAQLPLDALELRRRQVGFPERGPGHRQGIDRIALAGFARRAPRTGHELWRHAEHTFPRSNEVRLDAVREVSAVFERPPAITPASRPAQQLEMSLVGRCHRPLGERTAVAVHRDRGMRALVRINPDHDHVRVSSMQAGGQRGPVSGHS